MDIQTDPGGQFLVQRAFRIQVIGGTPDADKYLGAGFLTGLTVDNSNGAVAEVQEGLFSGLMLLPNAVDE